MAPVILSKKGNTMPKQYFLNRRVIIEPYNPLWPKIFSQEKTLLLSVLRDSGIVIEHIGSTAIPGLAAKPIIDMMIGIKDLETTKAYIPLLETISYEYVPTLEKDFPQRRYLHKGPNLPNKHFHLHIVEINSSFWQKQLFFRDYLRKHPDVADQYQQLKEQLAKQFENDIYNYCEAKGTFIQQILAEYIKQQTEFFDQSIDNFDLSEKILKRKVFENCIFNKCKFNSTDFQECKFCDCTFRNCNLNVIKIKNCTFNNVKFVDSKVSGINWTEASWPRIKLTSPIHFERCDLNYATFFGLYLSAINIIECRAHNVDFRETDLTKANLSHTDFIDSMFINTDLSAADFSFATNYRIDLSSSKISKAKFTLPEAVELLYGLDIELIETV